MRSFRTRLTHLTHALACVAAIVALLAFATSSRAAIVGYWDFENQLMDQVNSNHGTAGGGAPIYVADTPAALAGSTRSLSFAGANHVIIANEQNFDLGASITVSAWVKGALPGTWDPYISKNGEPNGWQFRRHGGNATLDWTTRGAGPNNGDFESAATSAADGGWHHILATFDGGTKEIWIDGALNNSEAAPGAITDSPDPVVFGGRQNGGIVGTSFEGQLDDVVIFNTPLAGNQIAFLAAGGNPQNLPLAIEPPKLTWDFGNTPNLQGWTVLSGGAFFRPDEGGGITAANGGGGFAHDPAHTVFLVESPVFHFAPGATLDGTNAIMAEFRGGMGDQNGNIGNYVDPSDVLGYNGGTTNSQGVKALGILDVETGQYLAFLLDPGDGDNNGAFVSMTPAQLAGFGVLPDRNYQFHYFDTDEGGWGWNQFNFVMVAGEIGPAPVPEPASLALLGLGGLALLRRRRTA